MAKFALLLHENPSIFQSHSPAELQAIVQEYIAWAEKLRTDGHYETSFQLEPEHHMLISRKEGIDVDGPYTETKEIIGGLFIIVAEDIDSALSIAQTSPHMRYGGRIELRRIVERQG